MARGSHSCAAEIDLGTTTPRKKPGPENLGSGDETRELHKTRVFHQIFNAADGPEKSGFRACLTEIRPKPPSINPQTRKKSHNQNPGFARKTQVTHSPIPGLSRVSPRSRVFPGCLCCVLGGYPRACAGGGWGPGHTHLGFWYRPICPRALRYDMDTEDFSSSPDQHHIPHTCHVRHWQHRALCCIRGVPGDANVKAYSMPTGPGSSETGTGP